MRAVQARLPQPIGRARPRKEIIIRPGLVADAAACAALDTAYATSYIWQLDARQEPDELRVSFRLVRLPRELTLIAPHRPPALWHGATRRGQLWLVAEEIEAAGHLPAPSGRWPLDEPPGRSRSVARSNGRWGAAPPAPPLPTWSHAIRSRGGASAMQLSLPTAPPAAGVEPGPRQVSGQAAPDEPPRAGEGSRQTGAAATGATGHLPGRPGQGAVAGYIAVAVTPRSDQAYLQSLAVDRAYRRRGVATRLLDGARRWAAAQGAVRLMADVPARNYPALRLLQKAGFAFCGYNDCCYPDNEVAVFFSTPLR